MIVDTFLYNGEEDLLAIRMRELAGVVDTFIAIMGTRTFQGAELPIHEPTAAARDGSIAFVTVGIPEEGTPAEREARARAFVDELGQTSPETFFLHGDVDEIPRRSDVEACVSEDRGPMRLRGDLHQHRIDWWLPDEHRPSVNLRSGRGDHADVRWHPYAGPTLARGHAYNARGALTLRQDTWLPERLHSGWHLQWVMTPAECVRKVTTFAHPEFNVSPFNTEAFWQSCALFGRDPLGRWMLKPKDVDETFPRAVIEDPDRWSHLLRGGVDAR